MNIFAVVFLIQNCRILKRVCVCGEYVHTDHEHGVICGIKGHPTSNAPGFLLQVCVLVYCRCLGAGSRVRTRFLVWQRISQTKWPGTGCLSRGLVECILWGDLLGMKQLLFFWAFEITNMGRVRPRIRSWVTRPPSPPSHPQRLFTVRCLPS